MINCLNNTITVKILSFINEFDRATNWENKEKLVKELKDINSFVNHGIFIMDENSEYRPKLIDIVNAIDYFLDEYSKKWVSDFNWGGKSVKIIQHFKLFFCCVYIKWF